MDMDKIGLCSCGKKYGTTNEMMACVRCNHGRLPGRKKHQTAEVFPSNSTQLLCGMQMEGDDGYGPGPKKEGV